MRIDDFIYSHKRIKILSLCSRNSENCFSELRTQRNDLVCLIHCLNDMMNISSTTNILCIDCAIIFVKKSIISFHVIPNNAALSIRIVVKSLLNRSPADSIIFEFGRNDSDTKICFLDS